MTLEQLRNWVNRGLMLLGWGAAITPTKVDDNIIDFLKMASANDEVMEFLLLLINQFAVKKMADSGHQLSMADVISLLKTHGHLPTA